MTATMIAIMPMTMAKIAMPTVIPDLKTSGPMRVERALSNPSSVERPIIQAENSSPERSRRVTPVTLAAFMMANFSSDARRSVSGWPLRVHIICPAAMRMLTTSSAATYQEVDSRMKYTALSLPVSGMLGVLTQKEPRLFARPPRESVTPWKRELMNPSAPAQTMSPNTQPALTSCSPAIRSPR